MQSKAGVVMMRKDGHRYQAEKLYQVLVLYKLVHCYCMWQFSSVLASYRVLYHWVLYHWVLYHWVLYHWVLYHWVLYHWVLYHWVLYHWVLYHWVLYHWVLYHWVLYHWVLYHWVLYHWVLYHWVLYHWVLYHWVLYHWVLYHWVLYHWVLYHTTARQYEFFTSGLLYDDQNQRNLHLHIQKTTKQSKDMHKTHMVATAITRGGKRYLQIGNWAKIDEENNRGMISLVEAGFGRSCARNKISNINNGCLPEIDFMRNLFRHFQYCMVLLRITY